MVCPVILDLFRFLLFFFKMTLDYVQQFPFGEKIPKPSIGNLILLLKWKACHYWSHDICSRFKKSEISVWNFHFHHLFACLFTRFGIVGTTNLSISIHFLFVAVRFFYSIMKKKSRLNGNDILVKKWNIIFYLCPQ